MPIVSIGGATAVFADYTYITAIAGATVSVYLAGTTTVASVYAAYQALRQHAKEIAAEVLP